MHLSYDPEANAAYWALGTPLQPGQSTQQLSGLTTPGGRGEIIIDFDADGQLLGVEILHADAVIRRALLDTARPPTAAGPTT
ncbi:MAG: hypothetical protein RI885_341 [Actinomycetota bacterium]|jgi:uncharacterized protein YuzE